MSTRQPGTMKSVLKNPEFRLFWAGACLSFIGSWVQTVAVGLVVYQMTGSKQALGIIGLVGGLPTSLLMLFGGALADRLDRRRLVLLSQSLFALCAFGLAALSYSGRLAVWHLGAAAAVNGALFALDGPARQAMVADIVGDADLPAGVALQSVAFNVARIIGPVIGSAMYVWTGAGSCFLLNGISFLAIVWAVARLSPRPHHPDTRPASLFSGVADTLRLIRTDPQIRAVVTLTAAASLFIFSVYNTLMPAFAAEQLGVGEKDPRYGYLLSAIGAGSLAGAWSVGRCASMGIRGKAMLAGAMAFGTAACGLAFCRSFTLSIPVFVLLGFGGILQLATANTLTQTLSPEGQRGRAVSAHMFAMTGLQPAGALAAGWLGQMLGTAAALTAGSVGLFVVLLWVYALRPQVRELE